MNTLGTISENFEEIIDGIQCEIEITLEEVNRIKLMFDNHCESISNSNNTKIYYNFIEEKKSDLNEIQNLIIDDEIFSPVILNNNNEKEGIRLSLLLIAKLSRPLEALSIFNFYYQTTLNNNGLMQLNIYLFFKDPNVENFTKSYYQNIYDLHLSSSFIKEIDTIQAFLTKGDPETTRGTVTTVKPTSA